MPGGAIALENDRRGAALVQDERQSDIAYAAEEREGDEIG
jgi:hypothetical protein